jgi:hypothetical protein
MSERVLPKHPRPRAGLRLRDGRTVRLRPVRVEDRPALHDLLNRHRTTPRPRHVAATAPEFPLPGRAVASTNGRPDAWDHAGLVALVDDVDLVGYAGYRRVETGAAELDVTLSGEVQGEGLGAVLVERLATVASVAGIHRFRAELVADDTTGIDLLGETTLPRRSSANGDRVLVEIDTTPR